ncbi:MAG: argininosuccinate synthase [Planctomycetes bacterium]|nr:argininosuccinate synthase [Planctomycetota bacterium]
MPKVALAYSGSLDTAICVHYLRHVKGMKVYTFSANLGQPEYLEPLAEQAVDLGATAANLADLRDRFARDFIFPSLRAGAVYEQGYFLFSALARPLIVEELLQVAEEEGCDFIAHGSRGIGNDRIRLDNCIRALAPDAQVLTPLVDLNLKGPVDDIAYAREHGIAIASERAVLFNVEQNLWGNNVQVPNLRDTWEELPRDTYILTVPQTEAGARPTVLEIGFERGVPVSVDGEELSPVKLVEMLNKIGGRCAVGRFDVVENRISGRKTRELYEAPAAAILQAAHQALEAITLDKETQHFKAALSPKYAELVYEGKWFLPLREGLDCLFARLSEKVTGDVRVSLFRGNLTILGRRSPNTLFVPRDPAGSVQFPQKLTV